MKQKISFKKGEFLTSALKSEECPLPKTRSGAPLKEIAILGRSNVGKSSLLNHLMQNQSLAKVSSTPGKTQRINFFLVDQLLLLVDLPGYGYAKVAQSIKASWAASLETYLNRRPSLQLLLFLLDIRRIPSREDLALFKWITYRNLPIILVLTKSDKLSPAKVNTQTNMILKQLGSGKILSRLPLVHYSIKEGKCKRDLAEAINLFLKDTDCNWKKMA